MHRTALLAAAVALVATSACAGPAAVAGPGPAAGSVSAPPADRGTAYFLSTDGQVTSLDAVTGGSVSTVASLPPDTGRCTANTLSVSPDAKYIAWVRGTGKSPDHGAFVIADLDGQHRRTLVSQDALCLGPTAIRWTGPDRVEVGTDFGPQSFTLPAGTPDPAPAAAGVWSVTGSAVVDKPAIRYTPPAAEAAHWDGWAPRSVSLDGHYVAIGWNGTDPSRRDDAFAIIDVATSRPVSLPEPKIGHAEFLADGTLIVRAGPTLDVLDGGFHLIGSIPLPPEVTDLTLIRYTR